MYFMRYSRKLLTHLDRSHRSQNNSFWEWFSFLVVSNCTHRTPGRCWRSCTRRLWGPRASGRPPRGGWESDLSSHPKYVHNVQLLVNSCKYCRIIAWLSSQPSCSQSRCSRPWQTLSSDCSWRRGSRTATRQTLSSLPHGQLADLPPQAKKQI